MLTDMLSNLRYTEVITITRKTGGSYVNGVWTPAADATSSARASVQPLIGAELQRLPEGQRTGEVYKLYTATQLYAASETLARDADLITWRGAQYQVEIVEVWSRSSLYYKAIIRRVGQS